MAKCLLAVCVAHIEKRNDNNTLNCRMCSLVFDIMVTTFGQTNIMHKFSQSGKVFFIFIFSLLPTFRRVTRNWTCFLFIDMFEHILVDKSLLFHTCCCMMIFFWLEHCGVEMMVINFQFQHESNIFWMRYIKCDLKTFQGQKTNTILLYTHMDKVSYMLL